MYNHALTSLTFQETQADCHEQETIQIGRLNWWRKLLASVTNVIFLAGQIVDEQEEMITVLQQPETYPINVYAVYCLACYDLDLYWYDF